MTIPQLLNLLSWLLPPLLGAAIGYITNAIAIKMLFRPLNPVRIFGLTLPFTPGIIPRQRARLAESIGTMVHKNLITVEALHTHLNTDKTRQGLLNNVASLTSAIINKPVSELDQDKLQPFIASLEEFLNQTLARLFAAEGFRDLLQKGLSSILHSLARTKISTLVEKTNIRQILISYIYPFITGDKMKGVIAREIKKWAGSKVRENTPLSRLIPEGFINVLTTIFKSFLPDLIIALFKWLRSPEITYLLETQGRVLLKNILDKLNLMQKFFISVAQYDKTLEKKMPEIVEDTLKALEAGAQDPLHQATFIESVKEGIIKWEETGLFDLFDREIEDPEEKIDTLINKLFGAISNARAREHIANAIDELIAVNRDKTLDEILNNGLDTDLSQLGDFAYQAIVRYLEGEHSVENLTSMTVRLIVGLINKMQDSSLARLFNIDAALKSGIDAFILDRIFQIVDEKLPEIVESFNVKALVVNKINSLKIEDVETLLLIVIEKHLKWINVFGALLGGLIGLSQLLIRLLN